MDLNKQLGYYVGEYIIDHYLPTLNTDLLTTKTIINISNEENKEYERLEEIWKKRNKTYDSYGKSLEFEDQRKYVKILADKYLPKILECNVPKVIPIDMEQFKKGIGTALWDSDLSWYSCKNVDIEFEQTDEDSWCSIVKLKLKID